MSEFRQTEADAEQIRAGRRARRDAEWAKRDEESAESGRVDERIDAAAVTAVALLPAGVGAALAALLNGTKPWRASDGLMSFSAVTRHSTEVLALAEALLAPPPTVAPDDTAAVLAGLVEEMRALAGQPWLDRISRNKVVHECIALVEEAQAATGARAAGSLDFVEFVKAITGSRHQWVRQEDAIDIAVSAAYWYQKATGAQFAAAGEPVEVGHSLGKMRRLVKDLGALDDERELTMPRPWPPLDLNGWPHTRAALREYVRAAMVIAVQEVNRESLLGRERDQIAERVGDIVAAQLGITTTTTELAPPTPSAHGVAELMAECARLMGKWPNYAYIHAGEIVRLLAPGGADET